VTEFPTIHTNIWDAFWAIPVIIILIIVLKLLIKLPESWFFTVATIGGLILSVFISHRDNFPAGVFMGFFYSGAAMGTIYSAKTSFLAYRSK